MTDTSELPIQKMTARMSALLLTAILAGCASPGAPQPPSLHLPRPVSDLQAQRVGDSVQLRWTMPDDTTDGLDLAGERKATVCRRVGSGVCELVKSFPEMPHAKVAIDDALPAAAAKGSSELLTYEVEVMSEAGRSAGASNLAYAAGGDAPPAVSGLQATVTERGVVLRWDHAGDAGMEILVRRERLQVSAAVKKSAKAENPLAAKSEPDVQMLRVHADAGGTLDTSAVFGEQYAYTVQRVKRFGLAGQSVEAQSEPSAALNVDVRDVFPPLPPQGLETAEPVRAADGSYAIDLSWEANAESDLAGYVVYRGDAGAPAVRVSASLLAAPAFRDAGLQAGHAYVYTVSAVDKSGNESKRSVEVDVNVSQ